MVCAVDHTQRLATDLQSNCRCSIDLEVTVIEHLILGAFLIVPLVIVAFLFSDELWQEHRDLLRAEDRDRRMDWRHPIRSFLHH